MAKIPNGEEKLPKISTGWVGRTNVTDDRQTTDGRAIANIANVNVSSRSLKIPDRQTWVCAEVPFLPARVIAIIVCPCVYVSVCLCVTRQYCIKTAKRRITQTMPRDSPGTRVYWRQKSLVEGPFRPEICAQSDPPPFKRHNFDQYPLIAPQP